MESRAEHVKKIKKKKKEKKICVESRRARGVEPPPPGGWCNENKNRGDYDWKNFGFINGVDNVNWPPYRDSKS